MNIILKEMRNLTIQGVRGSGPLLLSHIKNCFMLIEGAHYNKGIPKKKSNIITCCGNPQHPVGGSFTGLKDHGKGVNYIIVSPFTNFSYLITNK